jgi:hypothetical protein
VRESLPPGSVDVVHVACEMPLTESVVTTLTGLPQSEIVAAPMLKVTVPVGGVPGVPVSVAVNVTASFTFEVVGLEVRVKVVKGGSD